MSKQSSHSSITPKQSSQQRIESFMKAKRQIFSRGNSMVPPSNLRDISEDQQSMEDLEGHEYHSPDEISNIEGNDHIPHPDDDLKDYQDENPCSPHPEDKEEQRPLSQSSAEQQVVPVIQVRKQSRRRGKYLQGFTSDVWKESALVIVYHISKFLQSLQQNSDTIKFRFLSRHVFTVLNDRSSDFDFYLIRHLVKGNMSSWYRAYQKITGVVIRHIPLQTLLKYTYGEYFRHFGAFQPDGYFKILWDMFLAFLTVVNIFYIPMKLAFGIKDGQNDLSAYLLDEIPSWAFVLDIIINFNTAFYDQGMINSSRKTIILHYIRGDFILDFIVISVFFVSKYQIPYIDFVLLLRVTRVKRMFDNVEEALSLRERFSAIVDLVRLIYFVIFVGHFCACAWYFLATFEPDKSWLTDNDLQDQPTSTKYINSLYWSTITLLTVGYGDITPVTDTEKIFVIIMALITCGVFGYAINSIGAIFKEMEEKKDRLRTQMALINSHMRRHHINKSLQLKVRKYFEYYFLRQEESDEKVGQLLNNLAPDLKNDVLIEMYKKILLRSKLLRENISDECLNKLCLCVQEQQLSPDEILFEKGKPIDRMCFVLKGRIKIYFEKKIPKNRSFLEVQSIKIRYFKEGYVLGEKNFLLQHDMDYQAQAAVFSRIAYISQEDFIRCAKMFPNDYEKLCLLKDKLEYSTLFKKVFTVCELCGSNHAFKKCPFPFFQCNRSKIIYMENQSRPHERQQFNRIKQRPSIELPIIQQASLAICLNEKILKEEDLDDAYLVQLGFGESQEDSRLSLFEDMNPLEQSVSNRQRLASDFNEVQQDKVLRFDDASEVLEQSLHQVAGDQTPKQKKGILKKTSFITPLNFNFNEGNNEMQRSSSDISDTSQQPKKNQLLKINRRRNRHSKLTFKYDKANEFLSQMLRLTSMVSQKSMNNDNDAATTKSSKGKLKQQVLERQVTNQTTHNLTTENTVVENPLQHVIKEDVLIGFEKNKGFDIYFPEYNLESVLLKIHRHRRVVEESRTVVSGDKKKHSGGNLVKQKLGSSYLQLKRQNVVRDLSQKFIPIRDHSQKIIPIAESHDN